MNHPSEIAPPKKGAKQAMGIAVIPVVTVAFAFGSMFLIGFSNHYSSDELMERTLNGPLHQLFFVVFGVGMAYLQFIEGKTNRGVVLLRIAAAPLAATVIVGVVYLSAARDQRPWRNSISAYYHSSAGLLFILASVSLAYLLFTEVTAQTRIVIRGRNLELYKITDGVRIASAVAACVLALFPTAPEGGDLHSDNSVIHGFASLVLFVGLVFQVASYYLESRGSSRRATQLIHLISGCAMFAIVLLSVAVILWKVGGSSLFSLEVVTLALYFVSFTTRNYPRAFAAGRKLANGVRSWYRVLRDGSDRFAQNGHD